MLTDAHLYKGREYCKTYIPALLEGRLLVLVGELAMMGLKTDILHTRKISPATLLPLLFAASSKTEQ
jgi:hypothetical protein